MEGLQMSEMNFEENSESMLEETTNTSEVLSSESESNSLTESELNKFSDSDSVSASESLEETSESTVESESESLSTTTSMTSNEDSAPTQLVKINYMVYCPYCGAHLDKETPFCPECGADLRKNKKKKSQIYAKNMKKIFSENIYSKFSHFSKKTRRKIMIAAGIVACLIIAYLIIGPMPNKIKMDKEYYVYEGDKETIDYSIKPKNVRKYFKKLTWKSSNTKVVKVNNKGVLTGVSEGDATVTATTVTGMKAKCKVYVVIYDDTTDLEDAYNDYCDSSYATLSNDGTSLMIDTNPYDIDDGDSDYEDDAIKAILNVNDALGLPDSVATRMGETRSIDGTQSYEGEGYYVTWHYHPDQGLEVVYSEE